MVAKQAGSRLSDASIFEGSSPLTVSQPSPIHLGRVRVETPVILAPMAGVTDQAFRRVCRQCGEGGLPGRVDALFPSPSAPTAPAGLYVNEMVTARALLEGNAQSWQMVEPDPQDPVRSLQLYGTDPVTLGAAAKLLVERGLADHLDLNFGCPVPKVTRKGGGAAIPWKKDLFRDIVTSVVAATDAAAPEGPGSVPVTVKMRIGIDDDHITVFDAAHIAQNAGVAAVGLHARTQEQYYSGAARWPFIAKLKDSLDVPVFGNGDIFSAEDAAAMMNQTGCDAIIVGRGCQGRPWIFTDLAASLWGQSLPAPPTLAQVCVILLTHARLAVEFAGEESRAMRELRKHIGWYLRGFAVGGGMRRHLSLVSSLAELEERLGELDQSQPFPVSAEGSRGRKGTARRPHLPEGWLDSRLLDEAHKADLVFAEDGISGG